MTDRPAPFAADLRPGPRPPAGGPALVAKAFLLVLVAALLGPLQYLCWRLRLAPRRWLPTLFHRLAARVIGLRVTLEGRPAADRPMLILANHVSWLDIVAIGAVMPLSFVAKAEIERWPLFGLLAKLQRSVFVDRTRRNDVGRQSQAIAERLEEGDPIVLFAEGTTSDGNRILPFRSALVGAAREALLRDEAASPPCCWASCRF